MAPAFFWMLVSASSRHGAIHTLLRYAANDAFAASMSDAAMRRIRSCRKSTVKRDGVGTSFHYNRARHECVARSTASMVRADRAAQSAVAERDLLLRAAVEPCRRRAALRALFSHRLFRHR